MAYETSLTIADVMQDIFSNKYVLPSIQREYVWETEQIETLFDSLMQDYPIGVFLFWEIEKLRLQDYNFYEFLRDYHEKNNTHNKKKVDLKGSDGVTAVLDGQQRLTSIYIGLKGSYASRLKYKRKNEKDSYPVRYLYLNLIKDAQDENKKYDFQFLTDEEVDGKTEGFWYKVGDILNGREEVSYVTRQARGYRYPKEQVRHVHNTLEKLYQVVHKDGVLCYRIKETELDKVLNIFIRVNSGGKKLTYSDLLFSTVSAQWEEHDAREEITKFVEDVNSIGDGFSIDKDFVLKAALVLTDFRNIAFKVDNFNKHNMLKIEENWENIKLAIEQSVCLVDSFGYTGDTLRSNNALIPIAYYLLTIGIPENFATASKHKKNREKIRKWLIRSLLKKVFGGHSDNVIGTIRRIIRENGNNEFPIDKIIDKFKGTNKSIQFSEDDIDEYLLGLKYGKSETLSTLMLLYPSLDFRRNEFHVDHIYPKSKFKSSYLRKMGVSGDKLELGRYIASVNDIGNLQLLPAQLNEEKSSTDFDSWFNKHYRGRGKSVYREIHYLPKMDYTYPNFLRFLEQRNKLLREELVEILQVRVNRR